MRASNWRSDIFFVIELGLDSPFHITVKPRNISKFLGFQESDLKIQSFKKRMHATYRNFLRDLSLCHTLQGNSHLKSYLDMEHTGCT